MATIVVDVQIDSHPGDTEEGQFVYMILMHLKIENLDRKLMSTR